MTYIRSLRLRFPLIILYAVAIHLSWAIMLWWDETAANVTAIHTLVFNSSRSVAVVVLFLVALLALVAAVYSMCVKHSVLLMLPQQVILYISAIGALRAMWLAQFADGVVRSHAFLIADQFPHVLIALLHTVAIIDAAHEAQFRNGRS